MRKAEADPPPCRDSITVWSEAQRYSIAKLCTAKGIAFSLNGATHEVIEDGESKPRSRSELAPRLGADCCAVLSPPPTEQPGSALIWQNAGK